MTTPPPDLLASLQALDLTSADGRAGLTTALAEIERRAPGALLQRAAGLQLRRMGWGDLPSSDEPKSASVARR
jgi:hypothetical protein